MARRRARLLFANTVPTDASKCILSPLHWACAVVVIVANSLVGAATIVYISCFFFLFFLNGYFANNCGGSGEKSRGRVPGEIMFFSCKPSIFSLLCEEENRKKTGGDIADLLQAEFIVASCLSKWIINICSCVIIFCTSPIKTLLLDCAPISKELYLSPPCMDACFSLDDPYHI